MGMIKTSILLRSNNSADPFLHQGSRAANIAAQVLPEAVGFVQARAQDTDAAFAGVAEFWFRNVADALQVAERLPGLSELWRDNQVEVVAVISGMERIVMRLPSHHTTPVIKGVFPFRRKDGMSVADFQHHWWHNHGPIAALTQDALCYTQTHVLPELYQGATPGYDGITELYWTSRKVADAAMESQQMTEDQSKDAGNFVDRDSISLFFTDIETLVAN